jgi:chromosome segregation protein
MKLKSIDIIGFKSFADRVKLAFPSGVTSIVGPNGCGKSNVIEAIRWVLGEQNARTLRSERMEDVIFNGTQRRKPLGMAEVRLYFSDPEHRLGLETDEVVVSRKIFRNAESVYSIGQNNCRLRDVQDLFMDTGMGSHAYSMIEQSMVEAILSDRAEERRFLFEEAAGIMKYKQRRKLALRRLDATQGDLLRINDIVAEVERTVNSLARQVRKARRHQALSEKLRRVAVTLAVEELARLNEEQEPLNLRLAEFTERFAAAMAADETEGAAYEGLRTRIIEGEAAGEQLGQEFSRASSDIHDAENELGELREKRSATREWVAVNQDRLRSLSENIERRSGEMENIKRQVEEVRGAVAGAEGEYSAARLAATEQSGMVDQSRKRTIALEAERDELLRCSAASTSKAEALEEAVERQSLRAEELSRQAEDIESELEQIVAPQQELSGRITELESERDGLAESAGEKAAGLEEHKFSLESLNDSFRKEKLSFDSLTGEYRVLERLQKEMEGFGEGVRTLLKGSQRNGGLEGVVADVFATEPRYERAVEAALGIRLQGIIARDTSSMLGAIKRLRDSGAGTATFIARDLVNGYKRNGEPLKESVLAYCDEIVECKPEYEFLRKLLFTGVAIVEDLDVAVKLQRSADRPLHLVTLSGETLCQYAISGGTPETGREEGTLLKRRRRMEKITTEAADISGRVEKIESELKDLDAVGRKLEDEYSAIKGSLKELDEKLAELKAGQTRIALERESLVLRKNTAEEEAANAATRAADLASRRDEMVEQAASARQNLGELESKIGEARADLQRQEAVGQKATEIIQEVSLKLTAQKARLDEMEKNLGHLERECANAVQEKQGLEEQIERRKADLLRIDQREETVRSALDHAFEKRGGLEARRVKHEQELASLKDQARELEDSLKKIRAEREEVTEVRHHCELELERITSRRELIIQQVHDNHEIDISALPEDFPMFPDPEDEKECQEKAAVELLDELRERIHKLGTVNLLALEDYATEKERLEFLQTQREDLVSARESLLQLVEEINKTARQRFLDTFSKVQDNFQDIFGTLFEGGQAHVSLVDEEDPLESPIEVSARPRGKKLLGLGLLSGGEKALTALALLFAIYSVKPSPFCILDEVDAPLDDANIDRFLSIIRKFSEHTQFVIVTHNKRTMGVADCLYGVTMQEAGVSKVVSVRLDQVADQGHFQKQTEELADAG